MHIKRNHEVIHAKKNTAQIHNYKLIMYTIQFPNHHEGPHLTNKKDNNLASRKTTATTSRGKDCTTFDLAIVSKEALLRVTSNKCRASSS